MKIRFASAVDVDPADVADTVPIGDPTPAEITHWVREYLKEWPGKANRRDVARLKRAVMADVRRNAAIVDRDLRRLVDRNREEAAIVCSALAGEWAADLETDQEGADVGKAAAHLADLASEYALDDWHERPANMAEVWAEGEAMLRTGWYPNLSDMWGLD